MQIGTEYQTGGDIMGEAVTTLTWPGHITDGYGPLPCRRWRPDMFEARAGVARWCPLCQVWTEQPAVLIATITRTPLNDWATQEVT